MHEEDSSYSNTAAAYSDLYMHLHPCLQLMHCLAVFCWTMAIMHTGLDAALEHCWQNTSQAIGEVWLQSMSPTCWRSTVIHRRGLFCTDDATQDTGSNGFDSYVDS